MRIEAPAAGHLAAEREVPEQVVAVVVACLGWVAQLWALVEEVEAPPVQAGIPLLELEETARMPEGLAAWIRLRKAVTVRSQLCCIRTTPLPLCG